MYHWYYIWSPRYEVFHQILSNTLYDASGIILHPIFVEQSAFTRKTEDADHFFKGNTLKQRVFTRVLEHHKGEFVLCTDADLAIVDKDKVASYFDLYKNNHITCMKDQIDKDIYNVGCMLIKSTDETIAFFKKVTERVENENLLDQQVFNEELANVSFPHGMFSIPEMIQSNMYEYIYDENVLIMQSLFSEVDKDKVLVEKLSSIVLFLDISHFKQYIPDTIYNELILLMREQCPTNYVAEWELRT